MMFSTPIVYRVSMVDGSSSVQNQKFRSSTSVGVTSLDASSGSAHYVAFVASSDDGKAKDAVAKDAKADGDYGGYALYADNKGKGEAAVGDGAVLVSNDTQTLHDAIDARNGKADSLASDGGFTSAMDKLPADSLVRGYVSTQKLAELAGMAALGGAGGSSTAAQTQALAKTLDSIDSLSFAAWANGNGYRLTMRSTLKQGADQSPLVVLFTNVTWDLATAGRDEAFDGMFDWLSATLTLAERTPHVRFIVRVHPAEEHVLTKDRVLDWIHAKWPRLPANVTAMAPGTQASVRTLTQMADLVLTYCSTTGIEAAIYGKPIVVAGAPHYRGKGFTIDVRSKVEYDEAFGKWLRGDLHPPPDAPSLARRYFHLFFLRYHISMGWTTSPLEPPFALTIRDLSELLPGRNRAVDVVCAGILEGREIFL